MRRLLAVCALILLAASASAGPYDKVVCPITQGQFLLISGQLYIDITSMDDKPVKAHRERIANPLDDRSHEVLAKRGKVGVEAHRDKKTGDLFIHWGTLRDNQ